MAGFRVIGVDLYPQKHYIGDGFIQMDALDFLGRYIDGQFDRASAIAGSPPCQAYTILRNLPWLRVKEYPALILPIREMLEGIGLPYVIENVYSARYGSKQLAKWSLEAHGMKAGWLCGIMFGRPFYRHRLFETNFFWMQPGHPKHTRSVRDGWALGGRARDIVFLNPPKPRGSWEKQCQERHPNQSEQARVFMDKAGRVRQATPKFGYPSGEYDLWPGRRGTLNNGGVVGYGHQSGLALVRTGMEIDWPTTRDEVTQMIPPCYSKYVGEQLLKTLNLT